MATSEWVQVILMGLLVVITGIYAWRTFAISKATKKQANASVKMAEEMREQRVMASRPVIIQKAIHEGEKKVRAIEDSFDHDYFSHFEIYNAGNGPAVNLEICVLNLNKGKNCLDEKTVPFLRARDTMKFSPDIPLVNQAGSTCYLLCRYRSVLSKSTEPPPYRTGLPFEIEKSSRGQDKVIVRPGELLFGDEAEAFLKKS